MLYDAFLFHNELDLLELRLQELAPVVDRFVLVECTWTHQNNPKPLHYQENRDRFAAYKDKIVHVVVNDKPARQHPEDLEPFHRGCLVRGVEQAQPEDLMMVSDLDEIPRREAVEQYLANPAKRGKHMRFEQALYYYWANCYVCQCTGTRIAPVSYVRATGAHQVRHSESPMIRRDGDPNHGGWHFSYTGGVEAIQAKTRAFCHPGCAADKWMEPTRLQQKIDSGQDLYDRGGGRFVTKEERCAWSWPHAITEEPQQWAHLIKEQEHESG